MLPGITQALHDALMSINSSASMSNYSAADQCVQLLGHYLCHYYFPLCRVTMIGQNEIIPPCSSTCSLLINNEECSDLLMIALNVIENITILPDNDSCIMTHRSFNVSDPPDVSPNCIGLESK